MAAQKLLLLNGPNLDMLGKREPEVYGKDTLATLEQTVWAYAESRGVELACYQSNSESKLMGKIHKAPEKFAGIVFNPGAYTHYSYALRDSVAAINVPVVEVHLSDIETREAFRRVSVIAPVCVAQVKGLGIEGYKRAIDVLLDHDDLPRLGEGYEERYDTGAHIIIAGAAADDAGESSTADAASETLGAHQGRHAIPAADEKSENEDNPEDAESPEPAVEAETVTEPEPVSESETEPEPESPIAAFAGAVAGADMRMTSEKRQKMVRAACDRLGITALLIRDTNNIRWISSFDGVFDEERAHALLVAPNHAALHTDSRYSNALYSAAVRMGSAITIDETNIGHFAFAHQVLAPGVNGEFAGRLGFEDTVTYAEFVKAVAVFGTENLAPTNDVVLTLRSVKDETELTRLRAAQAITDAAFEHVIGFMRPGMTEREVQLELESYMLRHGADGLAFSSIVATGENGADPHAIPGETRLEAGQCVVLDFGARAFGYCSDMTRTVFLGQPEGEMARAWDVLRQANETAEQALRPGMTGREAHEVAEQVLADGGFAGRMGHGLGHGVGLDCHELPVLNARSDTPLAVGNVVTVEPGIYLPGQFGMRLEDCGVITANGFEPFTRLGHDTVVI